MTNTPTEKKLKAKISSYKSSMNKEKKTHGSIIDGSGKRYYLFSLYFLLNDIKKSEEYFKFYEKEFEDDSGEPVQKLCWAVSLYRMGKQDQAEYRLADLMFSNLYVIPKILDRDIQKYDIWHSSSDAFIDYFEYFPDEILDALTREDKNWIEERYDSSVFLKIRQRHIEIYGELQGLADIKIRCKLVDEAYGLLDHLPQSKTTK